MGIVYYANYLVYFERLRSQLLRDIGCPYSTLEEQGVALPVVTAQVEYKAPAAYEDVLEIRGSVAWLKPTRVRIDCSVYRGDRLLAQGYTIHACVALDTMRPARIPAALAEACR
jgi:acyl-CoA thioester hydrolase